MNWIQKNLRPTLDAHGFAKVKIQAPGDDSECWQVFDALEKNPGLDRLISAVGYHYVDGREPWEIAEVRPSNTGSRTVAGFSRSITAT